MMHIPESILERDATDALADKKQHFLLPKNTVYMDGNSLGPSTHQARQRIEETTQQQWQNDLIKSWNEHSWIDLPSITGDKIAPIIGAAPGQVICSDSISVNLYKLLSAALQLNADRTLIVSEQSNFPTDLYIAQGLEAQLGAENCQLHTVDKLSIEHALNEDVAVLMLTHVDFRSGEMLDMQRITKLAHDKGILVVWDLAHSAGAVPLQLDAWNIDFAVGCGYKYLNGGPGSPAFMYVAKRHIAALQQPLSGWMGHTAPFQFDPNYKASNGIEKMLCGTPPIVSMAGLDGALDVFDGVKMSDIRTKSTALKLCFIELIHESTTVCNELTLVTPTDEAQQGSQLSFSHEYAFEVSQALIGNGVIVDFRAPNIVRFGFTPLYLSFSDIYIASQTLRTIIEQRSYLAPEFSTRSKVT